MLLEVKNLRVDYHKVPAVRGLSLEIAQGEVVCMVGPNGAGKSTTAMTIAGVKRPTSGRILLDGVDISRKAPEAVAAMGVSLVPEGRRIFGRMSVRENLLIGAPLRPDSRAAGPVARSDVRAFPHPQATPGSGRRPDVGRGAATACHRSGDDDSSEAADCGRAISWTGAAVC